MADLRSYFPQLFDELMTEVHAVNVEKGWRTGTNTFGDYIALLHSECSEALEAFRDFHDFSPHYRSVTAGAIDSWVMKPIGVDSELADVLIRVLDTCDVYGIDIYKAYCEKMDFARTRPYQHGGRTLNQVARACPAGSPYLPGDGDTVFVCDTGEHLRYDGEQREWVVIDDGSAGR